MNLLDKAMAWFRNLSEGWQRTIFSTLVAIVIALVVLVINTMIGVIRPIFLEWVQSEPTAIMAPQDPEDLALAAERVRSCMETHDLIKQKEVIEETLFSLEGDLERKPGVLVARTTIRYCEWPPSSYSEADGYIEVVGEAVIGPGLGEATFASYADRIYSQCQTLVLSYGFGKQGMSAHDSFEVSAGSIVDGHGDPWDPQAMSENPDQYYSQGLPWLGFYSQKGEIVVVRNASLYLEDAECTS